MASEADSCNTGASSSKDGRKRCKVAQMEAGWDRCMHFLPRKQRFCNMARTPGQQFCGVHLAESSKGERIRCPVDPSHTVWSGLLAAHLKVCNTATANKMLESMPYYQKDVNSGDALVDAEEGSLLAIEPLALVAKIEQIYASLPPIPDVFLTQEDKNPLTLASSFQRVRHGLQAASMLAHLRRKNLLGDFNFVEMGAGRGLLGAYVIREAPRQANMVLVERSGVRRKADRNLEKLQSPVPDQQRDSAQGDSKEVESHAEEGGAIRVEDLNIHRARMDIRHLKMAGLPFHSGKDVVVIAKHLCGVATDLALRGLAQCCPTDASTTVGAGGVAIATCCHHACVMQDYVNSSWLARDCGLSRAEFETMRRWTGWTTLTKDVVSNNRNQQQNDAAEVAAEPQGDQAAQTARKRTRDEEASATNDVGDDDGNDDDQDAQPAQQDGEARESPYSEEYTRVLTEIPVEDKARIGRMVKRIFDYGRVLYLRSLGLQAEMVHYCDAAVSPENCLIIAWK